MKSIIEMKYYLAILVIFLMYVLLHITIIPLKGLESVNILNQITLIFD